MDHRANAWQTSFLTDPDDEAWPASAEEFRSGFEPFLGHPPHDPGDAPVLLAAWFPTSLGGMVAVADQRHLHLLEFAGRRSLRDEMRRLSKGAGARIGIGRTPVIDATEAQMGEYLMGGRADFRIGLAMQGTAFQRDVWTALLAIPAGETRSYSAIAQQIGRPRAVRAVARANGANRISVVIPCHRVIGADGSLTGYGGGLWRKQRLLDVETAYRRKT